MIECVLRREALPGDAREGKSDAPRREERRPGKQVENSQGVPRFPHTVLGERTSSGGGNRSPNLSSPEPSSPNRGRKRNRMSGGEKKDALGDMLKTPRAPRDSRALVGTRPSAAVPILKPGAERGHARPQRYYSRRREPLVLGIGGPLSLVQPIGGASEIGCAPQKPESLVGRILGVSEGPGDFTYIC